VNHQVTECSLGGNCGKIARSLLGESIKRKKQSTIDFPLIHFSSLVIRRHARSFRIVSVGFELKFGWEISHQEEVAAISWVIQAECHEEVHERINRATDYN
jgi:hypothetical protein